MSDFLSKQYKYATNDSEMCVRMKTHIGVLEHSLAYHWDGENCNTLNKLLYIIII